MTIVARHKDWVSGCTITESEDKVLSSEDKSYRRFTATIMGWRNYIIYEGYSYPGIAEDIQKKVRALKKDVEKGNIDV